MNKLMIAAVVLVPAAGFANSSVGTLKFRTVKSEISQMISVGGVSANGTINGVVAEVVNGSIGAVRPFEFQATELQSMNSETVQAVERSSALNGAWVEVR
jgi:hypothetical protein